MSRDTRTLLFGVWMFGAGTNATAAVNADSAAGAALHLAVLSVALITAGGVARRLNAAGEAAG